MAGDRTIPEPDSTAPLAVSFIVPVRSDAQNLVRCLKAILGSSYPKGQTEVIVADNGSVDDSPKVASEMGARVLRLPGLSVAALRNRAAREAKGEILAFVDADHEIEADWAGHVVALLRQPCVAAVGAPYSPPADATWVQRVYDLLRDHREGQHDVVWLGSGNLAVRRSPFEEVAGFDESLTTCEDVDLCARLRAKNHRILSDSRLRSVHHGDPATLWAVFRGELWRGQDNLRVTLRNRFSSRDVPSIVMPVANLVSLAFLFGGVAAAPLGGIRWAVVGLGGILGIALLRTARMSFNAGKLQPATLGRIVAVAMVYEAARGVALIVRSRHRRESGKG